MITPSKAGFSTAQSFCGFGDGDKVLTEEDALDALDLEQPLGQRGARGALRGSEVHTTLFHHSPARKEFQGCRIGGLFSLDEHGLLH
jgi:hypothetical protein